jgi:hypothetical protein
MHLAPAIFAGLAPAVLVAATPAAMADSLLPDESNVRQQKISRQAGEMDWPFADNEGTLACVRSFGMKVVIFMPERALTGDVEDYEYVMVTTDPIQLLAGSTKPGVLLPGMTIEEKIRRLAPFVTMGKKLCDQPKWTVLGPSEL